MKNLFVPYEIALKLKEKGFDEKCLGTYHICNTEELKEIYDKDYFLTIGLGWNSDCMRISAPLYQQVIDWLREKHDIHIAVTAYSNPSKIEGLFYEYSISTKENSYDGLIDNSINRIGKGLSLDPKSFHLYVKYYEALTKAIEEALTHI